MNANYPKIQTVFLRDPETKFKTLLEGQFAKPEFEYLKKCDWTCTEKIDGVNIRIGWDGEDVTFAGRTDQAQLYAPLVARLIELFPKEPFAEHFGGKELTLFGEGYGAKIQKGGGNYIPDGVDFILFDVSVESCEKSFIWLERNNVDEIAGYFGIRSVPILGDYTLYEAVNIVEEGFKSKIGTHMAEGLVMRPKVELCSRFGERIITKIKHRDFL